MKKLSLIFIAALACVALGNIFWMPSKAQNSVVESPAETLKNETFNRLIDLTGQSGTVRVIVGLQTGFQPEGNLLRAQIDNQRLAIKSAQTNFLNRFKSFRVSDVKQFEYIPYLAFETDAETLRQMQNDSLVSSIQEDEISAPALAESTQMVGANAAWASGFSGSGQTIAVLDSGVDKNHSFLNGRIVSEACYSSNVPASGITSVCPGGATESIASDSGLNCPTTTEGCAHGTHVAGIAAGRGTNFSGVARDSNIIAVNIFSQFTSAASCGTASPCGRYFTSDLIRGLERVRTLANTMNNIVAVNLSLQTGQQFTASCDVQHSATKAAIDNLRSVNIATIICSGNYSFTNALTAPACISTAISVGSVNDGSLGTVADTVVSNSDSSPLLHLLAPGRWINSSVPGGGFQNYTGTSMAAPHVAGAFAILKQRNPNATIPQILNALTNTGQPVNDSRNGIVKPRIRIAEALAAVSSKPQFDFDGDIKADISVFRPNNGVWYLLNSLNGFSAAQFGISSDKLVPADYDGDGKTDIAVFRRSADSSWYILQSSNNLFRAVQWGAANEAQAIVFDMPVPADYDGDGKADVAVFRTTDAISEPVRFLILQSSNSSARTEQWGAAFDAPVPADYDGDGRADVAVYRGNIWYINQSTQGFRAVQFGTNTDKLVPADYDGDGKTDVAVFRPSNGTWYLNQSQAGFTGIQFGIPTDLPVAADYDGDGRADVAVFRPSAGAWYLNRSTAGFTGVQFGEANDQPAPNAFVR